MNKTSPPELRRGWTTGTCAAAATKAALDALWGKGFRREVCITLPKGEMPVFPVAHSAAENDWAEAGVVKDAGDDPDVTHGALIIARVEQSDGGLVFEAGDGVGTVTKAGLPIGVGEPAINPVPRQMIEGAIADQAIFYDQNPDIKVTISIPGGQQLAVKTWNPRLGIVGGLSVLGTTGIVRPFSCSAWIASIHRGVDVARAAGEKHVAGCTGATSEATVQNLYGLPDHAMLDMGDFSGGLIKYIKKNPLPKLTIGGGIGKITKLAQGAVDLHSGRSQIDFSILNEWAAARGLPDVSDANTALETLEITGSKLAEIVAEKALEKVTRHLDPSGIKADIVIIDRAGKVIAKAGNE